MTTPTPSFTPRRKPQTNGHAAPLPTTARPQPLATDGPATDGQNSIIDRLPPHDLYKESAVLGSIIIKASEVLDGVRRFLPNPDAFFKEENQTIYRVLLDLADKNEPIDAMILHTALRTKGLLEQVGGIEYIGDLAGAVPTHHHAESYAASVRQFADIRGIISDCSMTLRQCYEAPERPDLIAGQLQAKLDAKIVDTAQQATVPTSEITREVAEQMFSRVPGQLTGLPTGFYEVDDLLNGLHDGEMIIIAARPSVGKTSLLCNIADHLVITQKLPIAIFSLEMSKQQIIERMICSRAGVDSQMIRRGWINDPNRNTKNEKAALSLSIGEFSSADDRLFIEDTPAITLADLRGSLRRLKKRHGIRGAFVDYLQLMEDATKSENRQQEITKISRGIKALAKELNIPIVALSQLNRGNEKEKRAPRTSDLRESGSLEQDADVVLLLHREAVMYRGDDEWAQANPDKMNLAQLIIAKQRNGPCETVKLVYLAQQTKFVSCSHGV